MKPDNNPYTHEDYPTTVHPDLVTALELVRKLRRAVRSSDVDAEES